VGTISGNTASGHFYEAGGNVASCTTGTFSWTLNETDDAFNGTFTCTDAPGDTYAWNESRLDSNSPTGADCGALGSDRDISGEDADESVSICNDSESYKSSYSITETPNVGYEDGVTHLSGTIGSGYYYETDGVSYYVGVSLYFVAEDGRQGNLYRQVDRYPNGPSSFTLSEESPLGHGYLIDTWTSSNPSSSVCKEHQNVKEDFLAQYSSSSGSSTSLASSSSSSGASSEASSSSSASIIAVCGLLSLVAMVVALF